MDGGDPGWDESVRAAPAAFPDVRLDPGAFAARAADCRARGARAEHLSDLFLAWSAGRGEGAALRHLEARIALEASGVARGVDRAPDFADEVRQALRVRTLVAEEGRRRIDDYAGRGPLGAWLRVAALRLALNLRRAAGPAGPDLLAEIVSGETDPELRHMKSLYRAEFQEALGAALTDLPERQRAVLRLHHVDGLRLAQLARLYRVHESTVSRWVSQAAAEVAENARQRLVVSLAVGPSSVDSMARMVLSNLDLSIARILEG
jgi:RNA polymerase sigma-70 factor (ECF subfamily)